MLDINDFDKVFGFNTDYAYNQSTYNAIIRSRRALDNKLFFDRLLERLNVKGTIPSYTSK